MSTNSAISHYKTRCGRESYFESPEEQQGIAWSILYQEYLGKEEEGIEKWLKATYPRMPRTIAKALPHHPKAFTRDIYDPDFGQE